MKRETEMTSRTLRLGLLAAATLLAQNALAVGTPAGTTVENTASATYSVNGIAQAPVDSNLATFLVDERVDFLLTETDTAATTVTPNQALAVTTFLLTNQGNIVQDFDLAVANLPDGTSVHGNADSDDVDAPFVIYLDDGDDVFNAASDTVITFVNELSEVDDGSNIARLYVVSTIPADAVNGAFINVDLTATAHDGNTGGLGPQTTDDSADADDPNTVQVVFADASFDGVESAQDGYAVQSAALSVTKNSDVLADEFGSANPKAIPGSTVEYEIVITNGGAVAATGVGIIDAIDGNVTVSTADSYGGGSAELLRGGAAFALCTLDAGDADTDGCGVFPSGGGNEVRVTPGAPGVSMPQLDLDELGGAATDATLRFQVTIN